MTLDHPVHITHAPWSPRSASSCVDTAAAKISTTQQVLFPSTSLLEPPVSNHRCLSCVSSTPHPPTYTYIHRQLPMVRCTAVSPQVIKHVYPLPPRERCCAAQLLPQHLPITLAQPMVQVINFTPLARRLGAEEGEGGWAWQPLVVGVGLPSPSACICTCGKKTKPRRPSTSITTARYPCPQPLPEPTHTTCTTLLVPAGQPCGP